MGNHPGHTTVIGFATYNMECSEKAPYPDSTLFCGKHVEFRDKRRFSKGWPFLSA
jgi:hypothetical protein